MIKFLCRGCSKKLGVPEKHAGRKVKCPKCGTSNVVPPADSVGDSALADGSTSEVDVNATKSPPVEVGGSSLLRDLATATDEPAEPADALAALADGDIAPGVEDTPSDASVEPPEASMFNAPPPKAPMPAPQPVTRAASKGRIGERRERSASPIEEESLSMDDAMAATDANDAIHRSLPSAIPTLAEIEDADELAHQAAALHRPGRVTVPPYTLLMICGWLVIGFGALTLAGGLLVGLAVIIGGESADTSYGAMGISTGVIAICVALLYGIPMLAIGALMHAIRDLARNSWRR